MRNFSFHRPTVKHGTCFQSRLPHKIFRNHPMKTSPVEPSSSWRYLLGFTMSQADTFELSKSSHNKYVVGL